MHFYWFTDSIFSWNQDISGLQDHEFQIRHPDSPALLYQFRLGDEKLQVTHACIFSWVESKPARLRLRGYLLAGNLRRSECELVVDYSLTQIRIDLRTIFATSQYVSSHLEREVPFLLGNYKVGYYVLCIYFESLWCHITLHLDDKWVFLPICMKEIMLLLKKRTVCSLTFRI